MALLQGVQLIALHLPHARQIVVLHQPLVEGLPHRAGRFPELDRQRQRQPGQRVRVDGVRLGLLQQRLGKVMRLTRVDDCHRVACLMQGDRHLHPVCPGRLQHHQPLLWGTACGFQRSDQLPPPDLGLAEGLRRTDLLRIRPPGGGEGLCRDVDPHIQLPSDCLAHSSLVSWPVRYNGLWRAAYTLPRRYVVALLDTVQGWVARVVGYLSCKRGLCRWGDPISQQLKPPSHFTPSSLFQYTRGDSLVRRPVRSERRAGGYA